MAWDAMRTSAKRLGPSAVTIGNFDGVHVGHRRVLQSLATIARQRSLASVALTFDPHPLAVVGPKEAPPILTPMPTRVSLMLSEGLDEVFVLPFTEELSLLEPAEFARAILVDTLDARYVAVGSNFRFGRDQAGDTRMLRSLGAELGFDVAETETAVVGGEPVSSTRVRRLVGSGCMVEADELLGRPFSLRGPVVTGAGIGSTRTVPTLNVEPETAVLPGDGVYLTLARFDAEAAWRSGLTNVGKRPTFNGQRRSVETHLLEGVASETPVKIELRFLRRLRSERKFPSAQSLKAQIAADIEFAERYFRESDT